MDIRRLRSTKVIVPTLAAVAVFGVGGVVYANTAGADGLKGDELDRASAAALAEVPGTVTDTERDDEDGAYEVEVTKKDGTEVDVHLDQDFQVISQDADREGDDDGDRGDRDADDRALSTQERDRAEAAATEAVPGTVTDVEASDDRGEAYEVEVVKANGTEWTVDLDASFGVVDQRQDD